MFEYGHRGDAVVKHMSRHIRHVVIDLADSLQVGRFSVELGKRLDDVVGPYLGFEVELVQRSRTELERALFAEVANHVASNLPMQPRFHCA